MASTLISSTGHADRYSAASADGLQYRSDALLLAALTFMSYLALAWQFSGPTYQMDEIGYLANAATLSGRTIDAGSSYYFGYSLFLLPGFLLFDDPLVIWKSVLVTNALLFAVAIFLLHRISGYLSEDRWMRFFAVALCALYPAYPTMAGYAFSTPGIVLVYVAACWTLCRSGVAPKSSLLLFSLLAGFLNWVHPTGLPVAIAAVMVLGLMACVDRKLISRAAVSVAIIVLMIWAYRGFLDPLLLDVMTPDGLVPRRHYPTIAEELRELVAPGGPAEFLTRYLAQLSYILIGSLALASGGAAYIVRRAAAVVNTNGRDDDTNLAFLVFALLSLLGVIGLSAVLFTKPSYYYNHYWFQGRYLEGMLLPFLLVSFIVGAARLHRLVITLAVFVPVIILYLAVGQETGFTEEVDVSALWPQVAYPDEGNLFLLLLGGAACIVSVFLPRAVLKCLLAGLYFFCIANQLLWHHQSYRANGSPSDLYRLVSDTNPTGACVAFTPGIEAVPGDRRYERLNQLSFYLLNYKYRRMEIAEWVENCDGPYLTYGDDPTFAEAGAVLVARELDTGLKVYTRSMVPALSHETYRRVFIRNEQNDRPVSYIARLAAADLIGHIDAGRLVEGAVMTTGRSGHVFYGPYGYLEAGEYRFSAYGEALDVAESSFDVASDGGSQIHAMFPVNLTGKKRGLLSQGVFAVPEDLDNFELRLSAGASANITFSHYDLEMLAN